ncbi:heme ABC exporter ATP-binding protein CcmA [Acidisoma sp. 7E03]
MLEARDLAAFRGTRLVFEGMSFALQPGEALILEGENGAGKTTLLRLLAGFVPMAAGTLLWQGAEAFEDRVAHGRRIGWLGHQDAVKPGLSVMENLESWGRGGAAARGAALEAVGLGDFAEVPGRMLSAGQRHRVAIARLLLAEAPLWLLDEPTTALDRASIARLGALLAEHRAAGGLVVAATHLDLPLAGAGRLALS